MKKRYVSVTIIVIIMAIIFFGRTNIPSTSKSTYSAGDQQTFSVDSISFNMV